MYFFAFILKNLLRRPIRTALTVLGLAVAVGSMVALLGVADNVQRSVESAFDTRRVDLIVMQKNKPLGLDSDFGEFFTDEARKLPEVERLSEGVVSNATAKHNEGVMFLVQGWKPDNFGFEDMEVLNGRLLKAGDTYKVMIGKTLASNLNRKVGDTITFTADPDHPYEVIAVFKSRVVFEDGGAIVSFPDGQALTGKKVTGFSIRVKREGGDGAAQIDAVKAKIAALRDPKDKSVQLDAQSPETYVESVSQLKLIKAVSWIVSVIAFVIGVITMVNTMAMSVMERTHEIGILRAVGWPRRRVMSMILGEAVLLALAAALVGAVVAAGGLYALTRSPKVNGFIEPGLSPWVVALGTAITVLIGVAGGAYPAYRAARLLPTEALRHD
ncbi:MAG: ABC transporter permease [Planctomycetes bacterium]|nr:ABC transporter permease [Planctomycetota bacterium]